MKARLKVSKYALVLAFFTILGPSAKADDKKTVLLVSDSWCPYNCEPGAKNPGILIEIAKRALEKEGLEVKYETLPWSRAIEETRAGKYDAIVSAAVADAPDFVFPGTHQATIENTFFTATESTWTFMNMKSLGDVSLGVIRDYAYNEDLDSYIAGNAEDPEKIQTASGDGALETNIKKLLAGRLDAFIEDKNVVELYVLDNPEYQGKLRIAGRLPETETNKIHIAFSPAEENAERYANLIEKETLELRKNGEMAKIISDYLNPP